MAKISPHLTDSETQCRCGCGFGGNVEDLDPDLLLLFESIRYLLNVECGHKDKQDIPVSISGPARCAPHNKAIGGAKESKHCPDATGRCRAFDIYQTAISNKVFHDKVLRWSLEGKIPELGGLGEYSNRIHIDVYHDPDGHLRRWKG